MTLSNCKRATCISERKAYSMDKFKLPERLQGSKPTVWNEYDNLALEYKPLSLAHGYPDEAPPSFVTEALSAVAKSDDPLAQQYTRGYGHPRLVHAFAELISCSTNRTIDPLNEVLITIGAFEALFSTIMGHVDKGDEVIIIEPFFDCYEPVVKLAGGIPRPIPLRLQENSCSSLSSADLCLNEEELETIFNEKTKMIIVNTPHNPTGKMYKCHELEKIAALCHKWNVLCVSDEVYERQIFDENEHIRMCTLPDMWERTITVGSAGKTFSATGWKIGWAYGPTNLLANVRMIHQYCIYACSRPLQEALAICFEHEIKLLNTPESFFTKFSQDLQTRRDFMAKFLQETGMRPIVPEGGYYIVADWSPLADKIDLSSEKDKYADYRFTKWMMKNIGLQAIPSSAFYTEANKHLGERFIRLCFSKRRESLEKAAELLKNWKK